MRQSPFDSQRSLTVILVAINVGIWLFEILAYRFNLLSEETVRYYFALSREGMSHGYLWQLVTFQFLHGGFLHLLFNCVTLYFIGRSVEEALGKITFAKLYFLSGFLGGILQWFVITWILRPDPNVFMPVVGASAGVCGLLAAYATLFPERQITLLLFFVIPVNLKAKYLLWGGTVISLYGTIQPFGEVAHAAHLGGIIAGFAYLRWGMQAESILLSRRPRRPRFRPRELVKIHSPKGAPWQRPKREDLEDLPPAEFISREVDPILDKISAHGIQSLTPQERKILEAARARMGKR